MTKIFVSYQDRTESADRSDADYIIKVYSELINTLTPMMYVAPDVPPNIQAELKKQFFEDLEWGLNVRKSGSGQFIISVMNNKGGIEFRRKIHPDYIYHAFFELSSKFQNLGISTIVNDASVKLADHFKINKLVLNANLDVGGYAWLRKGAIPEAGFLNTLPHIVNHKYRDEFKARIAGMTEADLQLFVLSPEFSEKWKKAFLHTNWNGTFKLDDSISRDALTKGATVAYNRALARKTNKAIELTSNEKILDEYVRHQTYLLRYAGGLTNKVLPYLAATEQKVYDVVIKYATAIGDNRTMTGASGRKWQTDFAAALNAARDPAWAKTLGITTEDLQGLAVYEAANAAAIIEGAVPVVLNITLPPTAHLISIVNSQPFQGRTLKGWVEQTAQADVDRMLNYAKNGIVQGLTPTQIARGVIGTKAANYTDGQARKAFKDIEAVILTLTNGIQNEAHEALYAENDDVIKNEQFANTLDSRTTIECIGAGEANEYGLGKGIYPRGKGPMPPLHFRCRSLRVPYINSNNWGDRPYKSSTEKQLLREYTEQANIPPVSSRDQLPRGTKGSFDEFARKRVRELTGTVPATTSYGDWLKTQTNEFQNEVLGVTRADMFRKGEITLDKFVAKDGDTLTLDELERKGYKVPKEPSE